MTAEIAVLNKTAVALAADSAVTISSGNTPLKIFESADKLFELSTSQPLGIMVYNGMQFLGVPLETVIKRFRKTAGTFLTVEDAARSFLSHLYEYVDGAPDEELAAAVSSIVTPIVVNVGEEILDRQVAMITKLRDDPPGSLEDFQEERDRIPSEVLDKLERSVDQLPAGSVVERDDNKKQMKKYEGFLRKSIEENLPPAADINVERFIALLSRLLKSSFISGSKTGLVFAGFGESELFPTLISFEVDGLFEARIRYIETERCDIDRNGVRALVRPFAQKEMVDRFLHGLDDRLRSDMTKFCRKSVGKISEGLLAELDLDDAKRAELENLARQAEREFVTSLNEDAFRSFQHRSRREIESMVEFMPKPELAKMAEALIDLTSIKRKVSQELETVGGPVDVALISKNDGFVWVKRKHYFPSNLNARFFDRNQSTAPSRRDVSDGY